MDVANQIKMCTFLKAVNVDHSRWDLKMANERAHLVLSESRFHLGMVHSIGPGVEQMKIDFVFIFIWLNMSVDAVA